MELRLLGSLELAGADGPWAIGSPKQRALLALLALRAGELVSTSRLTDELWPEEPPAHPGPTLQSHISGLRRRLGGAVRHAERDRGYVLDVDPAQVDARRFEELVAAGEAALDRGDADAAAAQLREALALWRGDALADVPDGPTVRAARARLTERYLEAVEARTAADLAAGRHAEIVGELEELVTAHPFRERLWARLMLALYRSGRQADALACYQRAAHRLADELGIDPGDELRDLERRILRRDPALGGPTGRGDTAAERGPAAPAGGGQRFRLPAARETPVGREDDTATVRGWLDERRLVTLTGPGGAGKSTLALHVARQAEDELADGALLLELAHIEEPGDVGAAALAAVGAEELADEPSIARAATALGDREVLVVLDNCEHLLEAAAEFAETVLSSCPWVRILATSRHPLEVRGEQRWPTEPLAVPGEDAHPAEVAASPAVQLLVRRARAVDPGFDLDDDEDAACAARIARELDGIPLAIELAGSRTATLSLTEICEHLVDRFRLLRGGPRTAPARHRTLEGTLAWSEQLLGETERTVLLRLAALPGGADRRLASRVLFPDPSAADGPPAADGPEAARDELVVADVLDGLVRKSLVVADRAGQRTRYRMLETVRAYFLARLDAEEGSGPTRRRLAHELVAVAADADAALRGDEPEGVLARLDDELPNLAAARTWALHEGEEGARQVLFSLVAHLPLVAELRVRPLLYDVMEAAADAAERADHPQWPALAAATAVVRAVRGDAEAARRQLALALERLPVGHPMRPVAWLFRVHVAVMAGEPDVGGDAAAAAVADSQAAGDPFLEAFATSALVLALAMAGRRDEARAQLPALEAGAGQQRSTSLRAWCAYVEGEALGDDVPEAAKDHYQRAIDLGRRSGADGVTGVALIGLSSLEARHGDPQRALPAFAEALTHHLAGSRWQMCWTALANLAHLFSRLGEHAAVLEILGAAERSATCPPVYGEAAEQWAAVEQRAEAALGPDAAERARRRGVARSDASAVRAALETIAELRRRGPVAGAPSTAGRAGEQPAGKVS